MAQVKELTLKQAGEVLGVTAVCLAAYRRGTPTKPNKLPTTGEGRRVFVPVAGLLEWAKSTSFDVKEIRKRVAAIEVPVVSKARAAASKKGG